MSDQIDFEYGTDTGEADGASIVPIGNGEVADRTTLNRPPDHLRNRTDRLREAVHLAGWVSDADRAYLTYIEGGAITWGGTVVGGGTGRLTLDAVTI